MKEGAKKRLCWNCEGSVSLNAETCPFCGVSVIPATLDGTSNIFTPPYALHVNNGNGIHRSQYDFLAKEEGESHPKDSSEVVEELSLSDFKTVAVSITLLLTGSVFFLFGLVLFLFSTEGTFSLRWEGEFWYIYQLLSIPLIYFGWKALMKID